MGNNEYRPLRLIDRVIDGARERRIYHAPVWRERDSGQPRQEKEEHKNDALVQRLAVAANNPATFHGLLVSGVDVNLADQYGKTVLFYAASTSIHTILATDIDVNHRDKTGKTAIFTVTDRAVITALIKAGISLDRGGMLRPDYYSPLNRPITDKIPPATIYALLENGVKFRFSDAAYVEVPDYLWYRLERLKVVHIRRQYAQELHHYFERHCYLYDPMMLIDIVRFIAIPGYNYYTPNGYKPFAQDRYDQYNGSLKYLLHRPA